MLETFSLKSSPVVRKGMVRLLVLEAIKTTPMGASAGIICAQIHRLCFGLATGEEALRLEAEATAALAEIMARKAPSVSEARR